MFCFYLCCILEFVNFFFSISSAKVYVTYNKIHLFKFSVLYVSSKVVQPCNCHHSKTHRTLLTPKTPLPCPDPTFVAVATDQMPTSWTLNWKCNGMELWEPQERWVSFECGEIWVSGVFRDNKLCEHWGKISPLIFMLFRMAALWARARFSDFLLGAAFGPRPWGCHSWC